MTMMSPGQPRVIDPILSDVVRGYRHPERVGSILFPEVPVTARGGQIIEFGKESFRLYNARRVPGTAVKRVQYGHAGRKFALVQDALEGSVPIEHLEDAAAVPGVDMGSRAATATMDNLRLALEVEQASVALAAANYDNDHKVDLAATPWTDPDSTPTADIETGREAIRSSIGMSPNALLLSAKAFAALRAHPKIIERLKYTGRDSLTTEMLAQLWDIPRVIVGGAITFSGDTVSDVWGKHAVMAYAPAAASRIEEPSYGYTYVLRGHPLAEETYYDQTTRSWVYPVVFERSAELVGASAGYLFQNAAGA